MTALPPLPLVENDEEENDPYVPPLNLVNSDNEESDIQACPLPPIYIEEEEKPAMTQALHHTVPHWLWGVK